MTSTALSAVPSQVIGMSHAVPDRLTVVRVCTSVPACCLCARLSKWSQRTCEAVHIGLQSRRHRQTQLRARACYAASSRAAGSPAPRGRQGQATNVDFACCRLRLRGARGKGRRQQQADHDEKFHAVEQCSIVGKRALAAGVQADYIAGLQE